MKGQAAIEFMIMAGMAVLALGISLFVYFDTVTEATALGNKAAAESACNQVAAVVSAVSSGGNGTEAVLRLPPTIGDRNYTVSVNGSARRVVVEYDGGLQACSMPTGNVTSNPNVNKSGRVRNIRGVVLD